MPWSSFRSSEDGKRREISRRTSSLFHNIQRTHMLHPLRGRTCTPGELPHGNACPQEGRQNCTHISSPEAPLTGRTYQPQQSPASVQSTVRASNVERAERKHPTMGPHCQPAGSAEKCAADAAHFSVSFLPSVERSSPLLRRDHHRRLRQLSSSAFENSGAIYDSLCSQNPGEADITSSTWEMQLRPRDRPALTFANLLPSDQESSGQIAHCVGYAVLDVVIQECECWLWRRRWRSRCWRHCAVAMGSGDFICYVVRIRISQSYGGGVGCAALFH